MRSSVASGGMYLTQISETRRGEQDSDEKRLPNPPLRTVALGATALVLADLYPLQIGIPTALILGLAAILRPSPWTVRASVFFLIFMTDIGAAATVEGLGTSYERPTVYSLSVAGFTAPLALGAAATLGASMIAKGTPSRWQARTYVVPLSGIALILGVSHGLIMSQPLTLIASGASTYVWLLMGYGISRRVDIRRTVVTALAAKALVVLIYFLLGQGFATGQILRPSFDSFWLAIPLLLCAAATNFPPMGMPSRVLLASLAITVSVLSLTRQSWLAMGLAAVLLILTSPGFSRKAGVSLAVAAGLGAVLLVLTSSATPVAYLSRLQSIPTVLNTRTISQGSQDIRYSEAKAVASAVGAQGLWGLGLGATFDYSGVPVRSLTVADYTSTQLQQGRYSQAHIPLVTTYLRLGVAGVLGWLLLSLGPLSRLIRFRKHRWARLVLCGAPLLVIGPWTPKLEFLVGLTIGSVFAFIEARTASNHGDK